MSVRRHECSSRMSNTTQRVERYRGPTMSELFMDQHVLALKQVLVMWASFSLLDPATSALGCLLDE
jgi:hypothetical protein